MHPRYIPFPLASLFISTYHYYYHSPPLSKQEDLEDPEVMFMKVNLISKFIRKFFELFEAIKWPL